MKTLLMPMHRQLNGYGVDKEHRKGERGRDVNGRGRVEETVRWKREREREREREKKEEERGRKRGE